jgi:hypothetical protein
MKKLTNIVDEHLFPLVLYACVGFVMFAFVTQVTFACISAWGPEDKALSISNKMAWKFDGNFKNHPDNIFYEGDDVAAK